jgi:hypothetical protein
VTLALLRIGDGRDHYHEASWQSALDHLPRFDHVVTIDDRAHTLGFAGAIAEGWRKVIETGADYVFHLELDFTFLQQVPLDRMIAVLERHPQLAQICLKRQPVNTEEQTAGGIVECHPDDYTQRVDHGDVYTEHRRCFSTNPCIYPVALCHQGWPQVPQSEGVFTHRLLEDPDVRFAFWGAKFDPPLVLHIGDTRAGGGY